MTAPTEIYTYWHALFLHVALPIYLRARLMELHGKGRVFSREAVGTDAWIDAAGAPSIVSDVVRIGKFQSRLVVTAAHSKPVPLDLGAMLTTEKIGRASCRERVCQYV